MISRLHKFQNHWHFLRGKRSFLLSCVRVAQVRFRLKRLRRHPLPVWNTLCLVSYCRLHRSRIHNAACPLSPEKWEKRQ
jgi:hypothetical protein